MPNLLFGFMPSGSEWIIIVFVILLLFGGEKKPELMRGLGKGVRSFKDGINEAKEEINKVDDQTSAMMINRQRSRIRYSGC
ncbi:MAG: twin-arginine translocase TatA/TatE family subunit [Rikenellaceae bacterium]